MARQDNPFPAEAVATSSLTGLPDYPTRYAVSVEEKIDEYLEDFDRPSETGSLILGIRGRYGSGKTHLALHVMEYLARQSREVPGAAAGSEEAASRRAIPSKAVYCKANCPDLYDIYRNHFAGKLKQTDLKQLVAYHYQKLLTERASAAPAGREGENALQVTQRVVRERSIEDPEYILELLKKELLPVGDLPLEFDRQLRDTEPSAREDFFRAYSKIDHAELGILADRWIRGDELNETEMKKVGVAGPRIEPKHAKEALKFLLSAYRRAGVVFLFCIDELERFRLSPEAETASQSPRDQEAVRQVMKDLAEIFSDCGQILVVSGTVEAWTSLPEDVRRARFIPENIIEVRLDRDESRSLLEEYCRAKRKSLSNVFPGAALERLLEQGEYNARRLLQIAHQAYKIGEQGGRAINERDIPVAAAKASGDRQRIEHVQDAIRAVAKELGLGCQGDVLAGGKAYTFAIGEASKPLALVDVLRSFFKLEEVEGARVVAAAATAVVAENPQAQVCVVMAGYSSLEVRQELGKTVSRVLVYDEDQFAKEFRDFLFEAAAPAAPKVVPAEYKSAPYDQFAAEAQAELERLRKAVTEVTTRSEAEKTDQRVERVGNKLDDVLTDLDRLMEAEEKIGTDMRQKHIADQSVDIEMHHVRRMGSNLLEQRQRISRALRLNEGQPRERTIEKILDRYGRALEEGRKLVAAETQGAARKLAEDWPMMFNDRRHWLKAIRRAQVVRQRIAGLRYMKWLGEVFWLPAWMRGCMAAGALLVLVLMGNVCFSWIGQSTANRELVKALNGIQYPTDGGIVVPNSGDPEQLMRSATETKIRKALSDFQGSSPPGSVVVENVKKSLRVIYEGLPYGKPDTSLQMKFIEGTREYLSTLTMLRFMTTSVGGDPWVSSLLLVALGLIGFPLVRLFHGVDDRPMG
jgi:hypothetical protein